MAAIITRAGKGSPLTNAELDANFINLNAAVVAAPGDMLRANNLSDVLSVSTARTNLGLGALATLNAVGTPQITDGAVTGPKVADGALGSAKWEPSSWFITRNGAGLAFNAGNSFAAAAARWAVYMSGGEAAGNVGNDFVIQRSDNAGAYLGQPLTIRRADGAVLMAGKTYAQAGLSVGVPGVEIVGGQVNYYNNAAGLRWISQLSGAEAAGNAGSDFYLSSFDNAGAFIKSPMVIRRSDGLATFASTLQAIGGQIAFSGTPGVNSFLYLGQGPDAVFLYDLAAGTLDWYAKGAGAPLFRLSAPSGDLALAGNFTANWITQKLPGLFVMANATGQARFTWFLLGGEAAGNVGADLTLNNYDNAGNFLGTPMTVRRSDGMAIFATAVGIGGSAFTLTAPAGAPRITFAANVGLQWASVRNSWEWFSEATGVAQIAFTSLGAATFKGEVTFGASADLVEPRGRYYSVAGTGTLTLSIFHQGMFLYLNNPTALVVTIPPNSAVPFPVGCRIDFAQWDVGQASFAPGAGVILNSVGTKRKLTAQFSGASLTQVAANIWLLVGDLVA
ncbi:MAG TPA: hypothetical protein VMT27_02705 [Actinomycetes bacterium]|nr:hypothetical protein [Actinomycetes bacterium]